MPIFSRRTTDGINQVHRVILAYYYWRDESLQNRIQQQFLLYVVRLHAADEFRWRMGHGSECWRRSNPQPNKHASSNLCALASLAEAARAVVELGVVIARAQLDDLVVPLGVG